MSEGTKCRFRTPSEARRWFRYFCCHQTIKSGKMGTSGVASIVNVVKKDHCAVAAMGVAWVPR